MRPLWDWLLWVEVLCRVPAQTERRDKLSSSRVFHGYFTGTSREHVLGGPSRIHRCPFPIGWLINRGVCLPL